MKTNLEEVKFKFITFGRLSTYLFKLSILVFILAFNLSDNPPPQGWSQQFLPNLNGKQISDISFLDSLTGYAVARQQLDSSYILKTTNGGDNWKIIYRSFLAMQKIQFLNLNTGFACGAYLFKTTNGGFNWYQVSAPSISPENMYVINEDSIWIISQESLTGGVYRTTNGGLNWIRQNSAGSDNPDKIYMFNARIGFIVRNYSGAINLRKTTDGGSNWFYVNSDGFYDMHFVDSLTGWKSTGGYSDSTMKKTTDGGLTCLKQILPNAGYNISSGIIRFSNINKDTIWGIGSYILYPNSQIRPVLWRTTNGGNNWNYQIPDTSLVHLFAPYNFISFINKSVGWAYYFDRGIHTVIGGDTNWMTGLIQISTTVPDKFMLYQNYPNPFNSTTKIEFNLHNSGSVSLNIYEITGREIIKTSDKIYHSGKQNILFKADDYKLSSGIYFYKLNVTNPKGNTTSKTKTMVYLK